MRARPRLTYANVVSSLALVIAMSTGGAYAASQITTSQIADGAVTTRKLHSDAATRSKIDEGAVGSAQLDASAVTSGKLASQSVGTAKLATGSVTSSKLAPGAVDNAHLAQDAVTSMTITDGSVTAADLNQVAATPAYARVHGVVPSENFVGSGLTSDMVTHAATGIDCWHDMPFNPRTVSATSWIAYGGPTLVSIGVGDSAGATCPEDTQIVVYRYSGNGNAWDGSYIIQMWP